MHPASRTKRATTAVLLAVATAAGVVVVAARWVGRRAAGLLAIACAVAGVYLVTGSIGWALITAVPFLVALDVLDGGR